MKDQELQDEYDAQWGDPRRCPTHGIVTSDPHGMFDAPCWECEGEMMEAEADSCSVHGGTTWSGGYCNEWATSPGRGPCVLAELEN